MFMLLFLAAVSNSYGQASTDANNIKDSTANVKEDLAIPDFTISIMRDSTDFSSNSIPKDGLLLIKYFSPDCDHCQEEAEEYFSKKDSLQNIKTIWISGSWAELNAIKAFANTYKVEQLNAIAIGKETDNYLLSYYDLSGVPFAALYRDNQLIKKYYGFLNFSELIAINNGKPVPAKATPKLRKE